MVSLLVACADLPGESTSVSARLSPNRLSPNRLSPNRLPAARIAATRIATSRLSDGRLSLNPRSTAELLASEDGLEVLSMIASCALPENITLVATVDGNEVEFFGELGLAPSWLFAPLDRDGQGWVSACIFSRVNANEVALPVSLRGANGGLEVSADERAAWTLEEGGFFGNLFGPVDEPLQWYACRGRDQAVGDAGSLVDRACAEPDPANPGLTKCGFFFAGDCGDYSADQACESFSKHGTFYGQCHSTPLAGRERAKPGDQIFRQVITAYVLP